MKFGLRALNLGLLHLLGIGLTCAVMMGAGICPSTAQAAIFSDDEARRAIVDLRSRFEELRNQAQELQKQLQTLNAELRETNKIVQRKADGQGQLGVQADMERMRQELASARGQIEELVNELTVTQKRQRDLDQVLERRVTEVNQLVDQRIERRVGEVNQLVDQRISEVRLKVGEVDHRLSAFEPVAVRVDGVQLRVNPAEKKLFDTAIEAFRAGDFKQSASQLRSMMDRFPDSAYMPSLIFWLGSSDYAQREFKAAIASFTSFLKTYAEHPRAADARLNLGLAQADAGERAAAKKTLQTVVERHPESNAAMVAKERLSKIK